MRHEIYVLVLTRHILAHQHQFTPPLFLQIFEIRFNLFGVVELASLKFDFILILKQMNWKQFLEQLLFPVTGVHVTDEEQVVVYGVEYLKNITRLLTETSNR